jgi:hypothetical protein
MNNKNKLQSILTKRFESVKNILKKSTRVIPAAAVAIGAVSVVDTDAEAGATNQGATALNTYAATDTITFTATTAITILTADDSMLSATNVNGTNLVWSYAGGNDLTITNALTATAGETITTNLSGEATEMTLGEASAIADANASIIFGLGAGTILEITNDDIHKFSVDGTAAFAGKLTVSGTTTFTVGSAGGTNGLSEIAIATGKTATFNETVKAATITSVGTLTALKGITGTSIVLTAAGNLTNTAIATYSSNFTEAAVGSISVLTIKNSADNEAPSVATLSGDVTIDTVTVGSSTTGGSAKFTGDVVAATAINVISGNTTNEDSKAEFTGDVTATAIVLTNATSNADSLMTTTGTTAKTITGTINGAATLTAANGAGTTFASAIGATTQLTEISITAAKIATFDSTVDAATLDVDGTATLKTAGSTIAEFELATTGVLLIDKAITNGSTLWTSATQSDTGIAEGKIYLPGNLTTGQTLLIADSDLGDAVDTDLAAVIQDTALTDYTTSGEATTLTITAVDKSTAAIAESLSLTTDTAQAILQARNAIGLGGNSDTRTDFITNSANSLNSKAPADLTAFAKQAAPQADLAQGSMASTKAMTGSVQSVISNRMASLRSGDAFQTGIVAGDMVSANSAFMQAIGSIVEQQSTKSGGQTVAGYDSETVGVALGFDVITESGSVFGLSVSAAETDVDGLGDGKAKNDIESYTASLYMDKTGDNGFIEGSLTLGLNEHDASRKLTTGGVTSNYKSSYDSEQVSLRIKGGAPKEVGVSSFFTPFASVTATVIDTDAHSESSDQANDDLRLKLEQDQINSVVGTLGFKVHSITDMGVPMFSFALNNEFGDTSISTTNSYLGGGSAFKTKTEVEEMSATLGLGYTFGSDGATLNIGYEAEANEDDYLSHFGTIKLIGKF